MKRTVRLFFLDSRPKLKMRSGRFLIYSAILFATLPALVSDLCLIRYFPTVNCSGSYPLSSEDEIGSGIVLGLIGFLYCSLSYYSPYGG